MVSNDTVLVDDPFGDANEDTLASYDKKSLYVALMNVVLITRIVRFILGLIVIVANILLIYVISKFKRLKITVNYYIRHYAISNIIYIVSGALVHMVYGYKQFCLVFQAEYLGLMLTFLFVSALGFDWLIMTFNPELGSKIKNCYKFLTPAIYILSCAKFLVLSFLCYIGLVINLDHIFLLGGYSLIFLFIIILDYLNFRYKDTITSTKRVNSLTVANIIVLCWLPMWIYHFMNLFQEFHDINEYIFWAIYFLLEWISYSVSIVILIVLVKMDKNFKMAFAKLFRRSLRHYSQDEDNLDESEYNDPDPNVFYHNATTCVKM